MKPSSLNSSTASSSSSTTSMSSVGQSNNIKQPNKMNRNAGSGSFTITNEKSQSMSSASSSTSSQPSSENQETGSDQSPDRQSTSLTNDDEPPISVTPLNNNFAQKLAADYDTELEKLGDRMTNAIADGSFFNCGLFQFFSFLFISVAWTVGNGWYAYVSVFTGYTPDHQCDVERMGVNVISLASNHSLLESEESSAKTCHAFDLITNRTIKCTHWKYDESQMRSTIVTEYDFVCDKNYYFELAYSLEQIGYIVGTLVFSFIADMVGRKPVLVFVLWSMCVCGFVQYFVQSFVVYIVIGFLINSLACGLEAVCVTLVLEMFSTSKRTIFGIGIQVIWVIVMASLSPLAYLVKSWREIRLIIFATLAILSIFSNLLVQESARWLISMSRLDECIKTFDSIAVFNRLKTSSKTNSARTRRFEARRNKLVKMFAELDAFNKLNVKCVAVNSGKSQLKLALDMFKNGKFRLYVLIMALNWFATALVYDGLAYLNNFIGDQNIFLNWILMNIIELPAQFVCYLLISRSGRRVTVALTLIVSGLTLFTTLLVEYIETQIDKSSQSLGWIKLALFVLAKFVITQSYSAIIVHAPELFPTNLRSFGYGICLFSGKITAVLSPIISFYISKIAPNLPAIIYGSLSILCGGISLYVPETLNRPLPNSVDDVVKWPRSLSNDEWKVVRKLNDNEMQLVFKCCYRLKKSKRTAPAAIKKEAVDEQQKCMYGTNMVKNNSSIELVRDEQVVEF